MTGFGPIGGGLGNSAGLSTFGAQPQNTGTTGLFGTGNASTSTNPFGSSSFGKSAPTPFGSNAGTAGAGLFGSQSSTGSGFGNATNTGTATFGAFGQQNQQKPAGFTFGCQSCVLMQLLAIADSTCSKQC